MNKNPPIVVIVGPTAVGKTDAVIDIAIQLNGEVVSADSMQIYRYMDIGSAKPTVHEMKGIPHYMIDEVYPDEDFSVACYQKKALAYIDSILARGKLPIVVGGTGLYINSLVYPMDFTQAKADWEYRKSMQQLASKKGSRVLYNLLAEIDPATASRLHENDQKRIIRALEVYHVTGRPMSDFEIEYREKEVPYQLIMLGLHMDRKLLYERINLRVDRMMEDGLLDEVKGLLEKGYDPKLPSMQGLGYKELVAYLQGQISLEEAVETIKRDTRHFAKRQITWFKRDKRICWFDVMTFESRNALVEEMVSYISQKIL